MYGTTFKCLQVLGVIVCLVCASQSHAQNAASYRYLKLTLGGGYGYFLNNFTNVTDQEVIVHRPAFSAKLVWQAEYRLRVGIESGYYGMYRTTRIETTGGTEKLSAELDIVPIFMTFSINVCKHLDLNFGSGWTSMLYRVGLKKSSKNAVSGSSFSMSNYTAGMMYLVPLNSRLDLGAELRYMYLGKTDDHYMAIVLGISYKFIKWKRI